MTEWIQWAGGECPIPDAKAGEYEIHFRNGYKKLTFDDAKDRDWFHTPGFFNSHIIAYRLIEKEQSDLDWLEGELRAIQTKNEEGLKLFRTGSINDLHANRLEMCGEILDLIKQRKEATS